MHVTDAERIAYERAWWVTLKEKATAGDIGGFFNTYAAYLDQCGVYSGSRKLLREMAGRAATMILKIQARRDELRRMVDDRLKECGQDGLAIQLQSEAALLERLLREE